MVIFQDKQRQTWLVTGRREVRIGLQTQKTMLCPMFILFMAHVTHCVKKIEVPYI